MSIELKPCPFCGADPHDARHIEYGRWAVTCRCGASGVGANTGPNATDAAKIKAYQDARSAWNTRTAIKQAEAQQPATGEPDEWKLVPTVPTEKMLLAYTGGAVTNAGFRWCRHQWSAMLAAAPAAHPAPSVPGDVARDAERYRWLRDNGVLGFSGAPSWRVSVSFDAMDAHAQTLDSNIDAAMLAAK